MDRPHTHVPSNRHCCTTCAIIRSTPQRGSDVAQYRQQAWALAQHATVSRTKYGVHALRITRVAVAVCGRPCPRFKTPGGCKRLCSRLKPPGGCERCVLRSFAWCSGLFCVLLNSLFCVVVELFSRCVLNVLRFALLLNGFAFWICFYVGVITLWRFSWVLRFTCVRV